MKTIFTLDKKNYTDDMPVIEKHAVRALIEKNGLFAMQKSSDGEYKIPGGGVEGSENLIDTLIREVREETGLLVIPESIEEIGEVLELREDIFEQGKKYVAHSYHYTCQVKEERVELCLTESEKKKGYHLAWADIDTIIESNEKLMKKEWQMRDAKFLKWWKENK